MIVVADTSVVLNLCRVQYEHLLQALYGRVLVPAEVAAEFQRLIDAGPRFGGLRLPSWIEVLAAPPPPGIVLAANLDVGETAAIALCLGQKADALLIDESLGRAVASQLGLRTIGILGILLDARERQLIPGVKSVLDRLTLDAGFWIAPAL